jgi:DNA-binding transcriptional regulator LsrR (DeoR family)
MAMASIARRFYIQGRSKLEIAEEFGVSRFKVARVLDAARDNGLVRIEIDLPVPVDLSLSDELRSTYGLDRALVLERADAEESRPDTRRRIGKLAADLLSEIMVEDDVLGLSWARSVNVMADAVQWLPRCRIVQLCGVQARLDMRDRSVETVQRVAEAFRGDGYPIFGPLLLPDRRTADTLRRQPGIAETFDQFQHLTKAVVSIGAWQPDESTVYDSLPTRERDSISRLGAEAEVAARLFDADGRALSAGLAHHVLAITVEELRNVPEVVAIGYGPGKAAAIDAVLRSGIVTTLVTDTAAAEQLLPLAEQRPPESSSMHAEDDKPGHPPRA